MFVLRRLWDGFEKAVGLRGGVRVLEAAELTSLTPGVPQTVFPKSSPGTTSTESIEFYDHGIPHVPSFFQRSIQDLTGRRWTILSFSRYPSGMM